MIVGEDYSVAPTCATCHMSATRTQTVTHDIGMRISWNNRPAVSVRPEKSDEKMNLPGKDVPWQTRRANMKNVCMNCHNKQWVNNWYVQYDALIDLYNDKFGKPAKASNIFAKVSQFGPGAALGGLVIFRKPQSAGECLVGAQQCEGNYASL